MKLVNQKSALLAIFVAAPLGAALAQDAAPPPTASQLPPAVAARLGGAKITPNPSAKPVEGLAIPSMNPGPSAAPRRSGDDRK